MKIKFYLNGKEMEQEVAPDLGLLDFLRGLGCYSVKCGCETTGCGLCTVWVEEVPVLSCMLLAVKVNGKHITTLEGLEEEAKEFGIFMADQGADQCGFCNPGFIMNVLAMERELKNPSDEEIKEYLEGNLCRCTGYVSQLRAIKNYLNYKQGGKACE